MKVPQQRQQPDNNQSQQQLSFGLAAAAADFAQPSELEAKAVGGLTCLLQGGKVLLG